MTGHEPEGFAPCREQALLGQAHRTDHGLGCLDSAIDEIGLLVGVRTGLGWGELRRRASLQETKELDRERKHEGGVPLGGNLDDRLK